MAKPVIAPTGSAAENADRLTSLLEQNLLLTQEVLRETKAVRRHLFWSKVGTFLKWVIILGPLIYGLIVLTPILRQLIGSAQDLLGGSGLSGLLQSGAGQSNGAASQEQLLEQLLKLKENAGAAKELLR